MGHAVRRAFERALAEHGLTPAHFGVLNALDAGGPMHVRALGRFLGMNRQTMTNVTDDLAGRGLVLREADPADRRVLSVRITAAGRARLAEADAAAVAFEAALFGVLGPDERESLYAALHRLNASAVLRDALAERPAAPRAARRQTPGTAT